MKQNLKSDRRQEPRYETDVQVVVVISAKRYLGVMKNISGGGMEIQVSKEIHPNTSLNISLQLPQEFIFYGKVIWTIGDYREQQWVFRIGIKTESIAYKNNKLTDSQEKRGLIRRLLPSLRNSNTEARNVA